MCAVYTVNPNTLPLLLAAFALTFSIFFEGKLTSEALPIMRQERSVNEGPLHGSDFLSVFIDSAYPKKGKSPTEAPKRTQTSTEHRVLRSTLHFPSFSENFRRNQPTVGNLFEFKRSSQISSENLKSDGVVLAVRVSSSVGKSLINKNRQQQNFEQNKNDIEESTTNTIQWSSTDKMQTSESLQNNKDFTVLGESSHEPRSSVTNNDKNHIADIVDQFSVASEDHPSVIAESNTSEFNIEEKDPITTNSDLGASQSTYGDGYVPSRLPDFNPPAELLRNGQSQTKIHPYQQTVIFHNTAGNNQARSVSYSTVAQGISNIGNKNWDETKPKIHERQERNFDGSKTSGLINNFGNNPKPHDTIHQSSSSFGATERSDTLWNVNPSTTARTPKSDGNDWESPEKSYGVQPSPKTLYSAQPEQNYEVDESVSVVTNGRVHGIQPKEPDPKINKKDDNQKVGYVVEGRNYRKYRVEERTSDGFIVGEYGVVSHDDGSLRGVRYTADGTINPRLIYDALMKFLSL
ncbi:hypothetical protein WA026_021108 [Henosepilachna vigintioctopunctata]|uniref:Uncharacterized protein n=1 Tax=Henosepilachna vigintioctopunctata TaxID=420089 RepID=A0AAW1V3G3_9CUCU